MLLNHGRNQGGEHGLYFVHAFFKALFEALGECFFIEGGRRTGASARGGLCHLPDRFFVFSLHLSHGFLVLFLLLLEVFLELLLLTVHIC